MIPYHGRFREVAPGAVRPRGHLAEFLRRQLDGLAGHYRETGYPFDTEMWEGISRIRFREIEYDGREMPPPASNSWWPYEQVSYLIDGLTRLGLITGDRACLDLYRRNARAFFSRRTGDRLGLVNYGLDSEWPFAVFFRAIQAYRDAAGTDEFDESALLQAHYRAMSVEELGRDTRNAANIEGMLRTAVWRDDPALVEKAVAVARELDRASARREWDEGLSFARMADPRDRLSLHGVTLSEAIKLPVLLYLYTGDRSFLDLAENALRRILGFHEQIPGLPSSNEYGQGKDPLQGYESCVITDFSWSLGYFLAATGKAEYADRIEKIVFNALPGSITKDFCCLQYLSSPNQVVATPFSNHSLFCFGLAPLRQYRPIHFAQCCPGNIHRAMPNFVCRMWMLDAADGGPAAVLYGPSEFAFTAGGRPIRLIEETEYPFDEKIAFRIETDGPAEFTLRLRIPRWCREPRLAVNGSPVPLVPDDSGFAPIRRRWQPGDLAELTLPMEIRVNSDRQWRWVERGPLVWSLPVPANEKRESDSRFAPRSLTPAGEWTFALPDHPEFVLRRDSDAAGSYPFDRPPVSLSLRAKHVSGFDELADGRYTPEVPLFYRVTSPEHEISLVPYGATLLRITAFPDEKQRIPLPVISAHVSGFFPCAPRIPLAEQIFAPESLDGYEFWDKYTDTPQPSPDGYYDLIHHFGRQHNVLAYLMIRFYAETAGDAVAAINVSDGGTAWLNGRKITDIIPQTSGEMVAPLWFPIRVKEGYNFLKLKIAELPTLEQHRVSWGAKFTAFRQ